MTFQLILGGANLQSVALSRRTSKALQTYQKNAIRFVFNSFVTSQPGAILNVVLHMNHEHTCAVAINALYMKEMQNLPSVILCMESHYLNWFYFMKKYSNLDVFKLTENNAERLLLRNEAIILIVTEKDHAILRNYVKDYQFFVSIVDEVDVLCEKLLTKQIQADFHLGFTYRNFITEPDQELRWKITNWALKKSNKQFTKLADFKQYDNAYLQIHVDPYTDFWETITWDLCTPAEIAQNEKERSNILESVRRCAEAHGLQASNKNNVQRKRDSSTTPTDKQKQVKRSRNPRKRKVSSPIVESFDYWSSDDECPPDLSVFEVSVGSKSNPKSPNTLRLKSPRSKRKPIDDFHSSFVEYAPVTKRRRLDFDADGSDARALQAVVEQTQTVGEKTQAVGEQTQTVRKTKSAHALHFDAAVLDEFSKPFDVSAACALQGSKSDSALLASEPIAELRDADVLREFALAFEPKPCASNATNSSDALRGLLTAEIVGRADHDSDIADTLNLCLSDTDEACGDELAARGERDGDDDVSAISSDDDLDACLAQFLLSNAKTVTSPSSKSTEAVFSGKPISQENSVECEPDTECFLRGLLFGSCHTQLEPATSNRNVINYADSQESDSFVLAFL